MNDNSTDNVNQSVTKCARFFRTLLILSEKQLNERKQPVLTEVRKIIGGLLYGRFSPEEFQARLEKVLHSQAQKGLLPFLQQTLPHLRIAVRNGELTIEGVGTSTEYWAGVEVENNAALTQANANTSSNVYKPPVDPDSDQEAESQSEQQIKPHEHDAVFGSNTKPTQFIPGPLVPCVFPYTPLNAQTMLTSVRQTYQECNEIEKAVFLLLLNTTEAKMRMLIIRSNLMAEHRMDPLDQNPNYRQLDDPKTQLKNVKAVEERDFRRRQMREHEAMIKMSKRKDNDSVERYKQIRKAEKEAALNREANEAALAALGSTRCAKRTHPATQPLGQQLNVPTHKPRITRIINRDVLEALRNDSFFRSRDGYYKLLYSDDIKNLT